MYREFFGLTALPFNNTPDPRFFYNTPDHEEALASLLYAAQQRKGFVLVTGEVGAGKTLLSRLLLSRLASGVRTAVITNTRLTGVELLRAICREFDLEVEADAASAELSHILETFLLEQYARNRLAVVILDEAQNLLLESFEELRMLGNLEADDAKLLQVLILGQPELQEAFRLPSMRQLYQRIFRTFHLQALNHDLTAGFIAHRLRVAGLPKGEAVFDQDAVSAIYEHSEGIPRLINQICDNGMLAAYTESTRRVSAKMIHDVVDQMMALHVQAASPRPRGAFARQLTGHEPQAPAQRAGPSSAPDEQMQRVDDLLKQMVTRLDASETKLAEIQQIKAATKDHGREITHELQAAQRMRQQAAEMLKDVRKAAGKAGRCMQEMLEKMKHSSEHVEDHDAALLTQMGRLKNLEQEVEAIRQKGNAAAERLEAVTSNTQEVQARTREMLEQAQASRAEVQHLGAETKRETERLNAALADQVGQLLEEVRRQSETQQEGMHASLTQAHAEIKTAQRQVADLSAGIQKRAEETAAHADGMREQVEADRNAIKEQLAGLRDQSAAQGKEMHDRLGAFTAELTAKTGAAERRLGELVASAEEKTRCADEVLRTAREQISAEAEERRALHENLFEQSQALLAGTQEQVASLLAGLQTQVAEQTEKAEKLWTTKVAEGTKTLSELQATLSQTRSLADRSRADLETLVQKATGELAEARSQFDESLNSHKSEIARLSTDAGAIRTDIAREFEQGRRELTEAMEKQREDLRERLSGIVHEAKVFLESAEKRSCETAEKIQSKLDTSWSSAERLCSETQESMAMLQQNAIDCHVQFDTESTRMRESLAALIEQNRQQLETAQSRMEQLSSQADKVAHDLGGTIESLKQSASEEVAELRRSQGEMKEQAGATLTQAHRAVKDLETLLAENRRQNEESRGEMTALAQRSKQEVEAARSSFESTLEAHKVEIARLTGEAETTRGAISRQFEEVRDEVERAVEEHRKGLRERVTRMVGKTDAFMASVESKASATVASLQADLGAASEKAGHISDDLQQSIAAAQQNAVERQAAHENESARVQREMTSLIERNRRHLEEAEARVEAISQQGAKTAEELDGKINDMKEDAHRGVSEAGRRLGSFLEAAMEKAEAIRAESQEAAEILAQRLENTQQQASEALTHAEQTIVAVREQGKGALSEVRASLGQMGERSERIQGDLSRMGDEISEVARKTIDRVHQSAAGVTDRIESLREAGQRDADAHYRRLTVLREQVEQNANQIRQNAAKLLDQVQSGATHLREHAAELLAQAQSGSDRISEQAADLLTRAQTTAEQFRGQAEGMLRQAEKTSETIQGDVQTLRTEVLNDTEQVREEIIAAQRELLEAREESVEVLHRVEENQKQAQVQADALLKEAGAVNDQSQLLLSMPKELVDESNRRATELSKMSKTISTAIQQLSAAGQQAQQQKEGLERAASVADEKLTLLARHTARVGQLVAVIRQLHGAVDGRITRLRSRLDEATDLYRGVPREIESLREVLSDEVDQALAAGSAAGAPATPAGTKKQASRKQTSLPKPARQAVPAAQERKKGSLGEIVQRNKKLNAWLRDVLGEEEAQAPAARDKIEQRTR